MSDFLEASIIGIAAGSVFAVGAIGLTLIFGILRLTNFAHGDFLTFGAYMAWIVTVPWALPLPLGMVAAAGATAILGLTTERVIWRPMRKHGAGMLQLLLMSIGLAFVLRFSLQFAFGPRLRRLDINVFEIYRFGDIIVSKIQVLIIISALITLALVGLLLTFTLLGKSMRALGDNPELAQASGINTDRTITATWLLAGGLAGMGGVLAAMQLNITPNTGFTILLSLFAVVILGGIGSPLGALVGAYLIGLTQEWAVLFGLDPRYKMAVGFTALILVLLVRPTGIFGKPHAVK